MTGPGTQGPLDLRPIEAGDIENARQHVAGLLRAVKTQDGQRSALITALAAIVSAADVLTELGAETAALGALRSVTIPLEQRQACRSAGNFGETLQ